MSSKASHLGQRLEADGQVIALGRVEDLAFRESVDDLASEQALLHSELGQHAAVLSRTSGKIASIVARHFLLRSQRMEDVMRVKGPGSMWSISSNIL